MLRASPPLGGSLLLVTDIHIMGLPLSITNRFVSRESHHQKDYLNRKWDSFIESPPLKRIEFASIASPSPMRTVSQTKGQPPQANGIRVIWSPPIFKKFLVSETTRGILRLHKWSVERETTIKKGFIASPSHQGRLRLQVHNVHNQLQTNLEISMSDVLT